MPHLFVQNNLKKIDYPITSNGVEFLFQVGNLIACKVDNKKFFISAREKNGKILIKYDKVSRPLSSLLKKAYKELFESGKPLKEIAKKLLENSDNQYVKKLVEFILNSKRGIAYERKM